MKTIPIAKEAGPATATLRAIAPPARTATQAYRAYKPRPFTRAERDDVTVLFGGLHWAGVNTGVISAKRPV